MTHYAHDICHIGWSFVSNEPY